MTLAESSTTYGARRAANQRAKLQEKRARGRDKRARRERKRARREKGWADFKAWCKRNPIRIKSVGVALIGLGLLAWAGVLGLSKPGPSTPELVVLLVGSAAFQIAGGAIWGRVGHVEPGHAKSAVRRLFRLWLETAEIRSELQSKNDSADVDLLQISLSRAEVVLGVVTGTIEDAISDWNEVHTDALAETIAELQAQTNRAREIGDQ